MERLPSIHHIIHEDRSYDSSLTLAPLKTNASDQATRPRHLSYDPQRVPRSLSHAATPQHWQQYPGVPPPPLPTHTSSRLPSNPRMPLPSTSTGHPPNHRQQAAPHPHPGTVPQYASYAAVPPHARSSMPPPSAAETDSEDIFSASMKYECDICKKRFYRPSGLKIHLASHSDVKPYVCPVEGCGRSFGVLSNMRRHARLHQPGGNTTSEDSYQ